MLTGLPVPPIRLAAYQPRFGRRKRGWWAA